MRYLMYVCGNNYCFCIILLCIRRKREARTLLCNVINAATLKKDTPDSIAYHASNNIVEGHDVCNGHSSTHDAL